MLVVPLLAILAVVLSVLPQNQVEVGSLAVLDEHKGYTNSSLYKALHNELLMEGVNTCRLVRGRMVTVVSTNAYPYLEDGF